MYFVGRNKRTSGTHENRTVVSTRSSKSIDFSDGKNCVLQPFIFLVSWPKFVGQINKYYTAAKNIFYNQAGDLRFLWGLFLTSGPLIFVTGKPTNR